MIVTTNRRVTEVSCVLTGLTGICRKIALTNPSFRHATIRILRTENSDLKLFAMDTTSREMGAETPDHLPDDRQRLPKRTNHHVITGCQRSVLNGEWEPDRRPAI